VETVPANVSEFFDSLKTIDASKTAGMNNSYLFDIDGAGQWKVDVRDGTVDVSEGAGDADTTISASEEDFMKIVSGEQNPTAAYMSGKLKIKGDMGAAMKLQKLF
jgi:putative sterol carrier protein